MSKLGEVDRLDVGLLASRNQVIVGDKRHCRDQSQKPTLNTPAAKPLVHRQTGNREAVCQLMKNSLTQATATEQDCEGNGLFYNNTLPNSPSLQDKEMVRSFPDC